MNNFTEVLATLENSDHIDSIQLYNRNGEWISAIKNQPGSYGSVRVYNHLLLRFGTLTPEAAKIGISLYSEHAIDSQHNPGKHPNIDRLIQIITNGESLMGEIVVAANLN